MNTNPLNLFFIPREFLLGLFLLFTSIGVIVPLYPLFPSSAPDPSWMFTLNEAVARGWVFGKEIIFTFGPYASIYTKTYHPGSDQLMLLGSLLFSLCHALSLFILARTMNFLWALAYALFIAGFIYMPDAILFSYPLIVILVVFRFSLPQSHPNKLNLHAKFAHLIFSLCFLPLGLLPLIKGSLLPICLMSAILCFLLFWSSKHKPLGLAAFLIPIVGVILFWVLAGQPIFALPLYFITMYQIISGYPEAMGYIGYPFEIILYLLTSAIILCAIALSKSHLFFHKFFLFLSFAFFLFIVFKAGFIRQNDHSAIISAPFIVIVALLLMTIRLKEKILILTMLASTFTWAYIDKNFARTSTDRVILNVFNTYANVGNGIKMRLSKRKKLEKKFQQRLIAIQEEHHIPELMGTSDIYSYHQSHLLSSMNAFSFRPVFQSYSAYTPALAKCNENSIRGNRAPDNILFRLETVDRRLPSLDDGLMWPTLINNYSAEKIENDLIFFKKKESPTSCFVETKVYDQEHSLNEKVVLPEIKDPLYAEIELTQTLIGKIRSILFKPTELHITVHFFDGRVQKYRFISSMAKSRFLISPLVESTSDFFAFSKSMNDKLMDKVVKSIQIEGDATYWNSSYKLKLSTINERTSACAQCNS